MAIFDLSIWWLGLVCFALVESKCLNEYWHEFRPKASSLCSAEGYYFKCNTTMNRGIKHVSSRTLQGNSSCYSLLMSLYHEPWESLFLHLDFGIRANNDRSVTREFRHVTCFPAPTQSREHTAVCTVHKRNAVSEISFGCLNIRLLLNKYDNVAELCHGGQH